MDPEQGRELYQLLRVARYYLDLAGHRISGREEIQQRVASNRVRPGAVLAREDFEGLYLSADLASAAVRLSTIEERTDKHHWNRVESYFAGANCPSEDLISLAVDGSWLHGMMRDNIGHVETHGITATNEVRVRMQQRRIDRVRILGGLTFGQIYDTLHRTTATLQRRIDELLQTKGIFSEGHSAILSSNNTGSRNAAP